MAHSVVALRLLLLSQVHLPLGAPHSTRPYPHPAAEEKHEFEIPATAAGSFAGQLFAVAAVVEEIVAAAAGAAAAGALAFFVAGSKSSRRAGFVAAGAVPTHSDSDE